VSAAIEKRMNNKNAEKLLEFCETVRRKLDNAVDMLSSYYCPLCGQHVRDERPLLEIIDLLHEKFPNYDFGGVEYECRLCKTSIIYLPEVEKLKVLKKWRRGDFQLLTPRPVRQMLDRFSHIGEIAEVQKSDDKYWLMTLKSGENFITDCSPENISRICSFDYSSDRK